MANSDCQRSARTKPVDAMPKAAPSIRGARNVGMGARVLAVIATPDY
jgi:hypothetical protein